ncbi:unnamed protein product [Ilex paraguariensis]|uniref:Jacalin-type lectin domain-containing protein n=1 Tax=Ilex paraguariensis TaxID=185542 RepID=A0ABC8RLH3_9AQUA
MDFYDTAWDESGRCEIVQIFVSHGDRGRINSIQFQYAENGTLVLSNTYGKSSRLSFDVVRLDYPSEYLTWVSGHKAVYRGGISSLAFGTNRATHGPFGCPREEDIEFRIHFGLDLDRQFGGFHGQKSYDNLHIAWDVPIFDAGVKLGNVGITEYDESHTPEGDDGHGFGGFHGTVEHALNSIGVYFKPDTSGHP